MNIEELREVYQARPFKPFEIRTADGDIFDIRHPENMALDEESDTVVCRTKRHSWAVVDIEQITSLQRPTKSARKGK